MINYTIIIPHKNSAELLEYCLSTIPVRDDVQVIVVDDNSDPEKVDFNHFPQWKGKNYEYYLTKEGKGAGYARNVGLEHAKGKWLLFVDADDFLLPTINDIFDECVNSDAEVIYFRPQAVMLEDRQSPSNRADAYNDLIDEYFATNQENSIRTGFYVPWSKFVRESLIKKRNICFAEIQYSNDLEFSAAVGSYASLIEVRDTSYYVVTKSNNSLTSKMMSKPNEILIRSAAFIRSQKVIFDCGWSIEEQKMINFLRQLYPSYMSDFIRYFKMALSFGYTRRELLNKLFSPTSIKAIFIKCYVYIKAL